jgi:hypothetical protein
VDVRDEQRFFVADDARDTQRSSGALVVRQHPEARDEAKSALLLAPFEHSSFRSAMPALQPVIEATRDYRGRVQFTPHNGGLASFRGWNQHEFVWVTTHGEVINVDGGQRTMLLTGIPCGVDGYLARAPNAMIGEQTAANVLTLLREGRPEAAILATLGPDAATHWAALMQRGTEFTRDATMGTHGASCVPANDHGSAGSVQRIEVLGLDARFWAQAYPHGLGNTVVLLDACRGSAAQIRPASPSRVIGWTDYVKTDHSIRAAGDFVRQLMAGVSVDQALSRGTARYELEYCSAAAAWDTSAGPSCTADRGHVGTMIITSLRRSFSGSGGGDARVREVVRGLHPITGASMDEHEAAGAIDAVHRADHWDFSFNVRVDGFTASEVAAQRVGVRHPSGAIIAAPTMIPTERARYGLVGAETTPSLAIGVVEWTMNVSVPASLVDSDGDVELELFVTLPEGEESKDRFTVHLGTPGPDEWNLRATGPVGASLSGTLVSAPAAQAVNDRWTLQLLHGTSDTRPGVHLVLSGHPGRRPACGGEVGRFAAAISFQQSRFLFSGEVQLEVSQFDAEALRATWSGQVEAVDTARPMEPRVLVDVTGSMRWHRGGCSTDVTPTTTYVGSMNAAEAHTCIEYFSGSVISTPEIFRTGCDEGGAGALCLFPPERCAAAGRIGSCSYRAQGVIEGLRDTVMHHYRLPEESTIEELQLGCRVQNGTWIAP